MTAHQTDATTDPHSIIAALRAERDAALSEKAALAEALAQRNSEYGERIEQQSATIDVLKVMSASPSDPLPVFDLIANRARAFCEADAAMVALLEDGMLHLRTHIGATQAASAAYEAYFPCPVDDTTTLGRAVLTRAPVHNPDILGDPGYRMKAITSVNLVRSNAAVPILRGGAPIGAIGIAWLSVGQFPSAQLELLKTFAEQAVIAIASAETYRALQARTADIQQSLEYQTATNDVLKAISRSTFDLHPVLTMVAETAARLCVADQAAIYLVRDGMVRLATNFGFPLEYEAAIARWGEFPHFPNPATVGYRTIAERQIVHIPDVAAVPGYSEVPVKLGKQRTSLGVPLLRDREAVGLILLARQRVETFTDQQIELVSAFADQAVIAIENTRLIAEQREALEQQTATTEVLQVINASPGNLTPVFDAILEKAHNLCNVAVGSLSVYVAGFVHTAATRGFSGEYQALLRRPYPAIGSHQALMHGGPSRQTPDFRTVPVSPEMASSLDHLERMNLRTGLWVPLRKDGTALGCISLYRDKVQPFSEKEIALLENFAAQAVIAMENARLITEQREALEQQTATAEILRVISSSPADLQPTFDAIAAAAKTLTDAALGSVVTYDGRLIHVAALAGFSPIEFEEIQRLFPIPADHGTATGRAILTRQAAHIEDLAVDPQHAYRTLAQSSGQTVLAVPMLRDGIPTGAINVQRRGKEPFTDKQIDVIRTFADQAVIAMENARLLSELRARTDELAQRQAELRVTFENMGDGVAMFDETQHLVAWNRKFQDILDVPDDIIARRQTFSEYVRYLAQRGEYDAGADPEEQVRRLIEQAGQARTDERTRPDGRVIEIRHNPVAGGGFVLIYADITERKQNEAALRAARDAAEEASRTIEAAFRELKAAQANLIQAEKMASLGQLTAGIAHEIKNPLNFVNNFSALSAELIDELREVLAPQSLGDTVRAEVDDLTALLKGNLEKVVQHGQRADGIVKAMLEHSRGSSAERRMVDLNAMTDEALNLAYHGARAQDQSFNITLERDFGEGIAPIEVNPQDMTRVFLNIFSNGFYAANTRVSNGGDAEFVPTLKITTRDAGDVVEIRVRDNGTGIPSEIRDKLFQPFFTTKPTGEGTGLGLSITYDIVTKQHGGTITVDSEVDAFTEFVVTLPRQMFANVGGRA